MASPEQPDNTATSHPGLKGAALAITAFQPSRPPPTHVEKRRKRVRKSSSKQQYSLELMTNNDTKPPHELAAEGNLEELKVWFEMFGTTIKETDEKGGTLLHAATRTNQLQVMQYLIESGINLDAADDDGNTALHIAVTNGNIEALHLLLNSGASNIILNNKKDGALHIAVGRTTTEVLAAFLEHPVELVVPGYRKRTPLHVIAEHDNLEACKVLHNSCLVNLVFKNNVGFRLCAADEDNLTPIHLAARNGSHRVLNFMMTGCMEHGYPIEVVLSFLDEENSTPLHAAVDGGHLEVVRVLLKHGADPGMNREEQPPPIHVACSQGQLEMVKLMVEHRGREILQCQDQYGQLPLHRAVHAIRNKEVISYLLEQGASIDAVDSQGRSPLHQACIVGSQSAVEQLIDHGANPLLKDSRGLNACHHAVQNNRKFILQRLLQLPCATQLAYDMSDDSKSPIHFALLRGSSDLLSPLISAVRLQVSNCKDSCGNNYLHLAAQSGDWKALSTLLDHPDCQPLLNETNSYGGTPLHFAAGNGDIRCVELLLSHGAMIHKCHLGHTPFMYACSKGNPECARVCFEAHPFQAGWTDDKRNTALHLAVTSGCPMTVKLALDKGIPVTLNHNQDSFLDMIIEKGAVKMAAFVVSHDRWQECLDLVSPARPHPMISLITRMPEVAKMVLNRCHTKPQDVNSEDANYWEKFSFKYLHLKSLRSDEGDESDSPEESSPLLQEDDTAKMYSIHDSSIRYKGKSHHEAQTRSTSKQQHLESLKMMVKYRRADLLIHPVVKHFMKGKWRDYGRYVYILYCLLFAIQVILLSAFIVAVPAQFETQEMDGNGTGNASVYTLSTSSKALRFITLFFTVINTLSWIFTGVGLRSAIFNFVQNTVFWVDGLANIFTLICTIPFTGVNGILWEPLALASFFSWFSLILKLQLFDLFGVYVTMFLQITRTVFLVLLIFVFFIIAFSLSLYVLAGNLPLFSTFGNSLFINFGYLLGEIDYAGFVFENKDGNLRYDVLIFLFVIVLAILLAIVVQNLLIGLAVGDIETIRLNSVVEKTSIEVGVFSRLDCIVPKKILERYERPSRIIFPNANVSLIRKAWRFFWRTVKGEDPTSSETDGDSHDHLTQIQLREFACLKQRLEELSLNQEKMMETIFLMRKELLDSKQDNE